MANGITDIIVRTAVIISSAVVGLMSPVVFAQDVVPQQTTTTTTTTTVNPNPAPVVQVVPATSVQTVQPPMMQLTPAPRVIEAAPVPTAVVEEDTNPIEPANTNPRVQQWLRQNAPQPPVPVNSQFPRVAFPAQVRSPADIPEGNGIPPRTNGRRPLSFEERQQQLVQVAPDSLIPQDPDAKFAFNQMMQQNMPLTPEQTVQLRQQVDVSQRAAAIPANVPPKPMSSTIMVNLAPGSTPPAIRLAQGYVSSLVFVDSTGQPWPIAAFDIGNPKAVNIQWDGKSNIILIQGVQPYSNGDIVVRLVGLPTPVTLELVAGQPVVDYRVDLHVSGMGPNSKDIVIGTDLPNSASSLLLGVLDGVAPPGSRALSVIGADAQAWLLGSRMFLRTRLTVLSPGWIGTMVSPDGMHAYELARTSTVLVSKYGEPAELRVEGF